MTELNLCRLYHCRPSELKQENALTVLRHMEIIDCEEKVRRSREGS
jgi:hypothetical protein